MMGKGHFCRRSDYHRILVGPSKNKKCTQSNIEKSGRARAIFVVGQNLAKTCTQFFIENRKDQRPIWLSWNPEKAPAYPQWGEATQMHTMRLCIFKSRPSERSHENTPLVRAKSMQVVWLLHNHKIKPCHSYAYPQWGEAIQVHIMRLCIYTKTNISKSPVALICFSLFFYWFLYKCIHMHQSAYISDMTLH